MTRAKLGGLAALLLVLTACSDDGSPEPTANNESPTRTREFTPSETPRPSPSPTGVEPNLGESALKVGETRKGLWVTTTVHELRYPYPPGEYRRPDAGHTFVGLKMKQCLDEDADLSDGPIQSAYADEFRAVTRGGNEYGGGPTWSDWPSPKFPELVDLIPGRCVQGWVAFQVPNGTRFASLLWRSGGRAIAEWLPRT